MPEYSKVFINIPSLIGFLIHSPVCELSSLKAPDGGMQGRSRSQISWTRTTLTLSSGLTRSDRSRVAPVMPEGDSVCPSDGSRQTFSQFLLQGSFVIFSFFHPSLSFVFFFGRWRLTMNFEKTKHGQMFGRETK